jgi:hypothetical protein
MPFNKCLIHPSLNALMLITLLASLVSFRIPWILVTSRVRLWVAAAAIITAIVTPILAVVVHRRRGLWVALPQRTLVAHGPERHFASVDRRSAKGLFDHIVGTRRWSLSGPCAKRAKGRYSAFDLAASRTLTGLTSPCDCATA